MSYNEETIKREMLIMKKLMKFVGYGILAYIGFKVIEFILGILIVTIALMAA